MKTLALYITLFFATNAADSALTCCTENTVVISKDDMPNIDFYNDVQLSFDAYITGEITIEVYTPQGRLASVSKMNLNHQKEITLGNNNFGNDRKYTIFIIGEDINMMMRVERKIAQNYIPDYVYHIE